MKIDRANKRRISDSSDLPDVSCALTAFFQTIKINIITKEQVDGYTQETKKCLITQGVVQPFTADQLVLKPEGERTWKHDKLHCLPDVKLKLDDIVEIREVRYRVMAMADYAAYGYNEFDLTEAYRSAE